jgi:hypothetical protein
MVIAPQRQIWAEKSNHRVNKGIISLVATYNVDCTGIAHLQTQMLLVNEKSTRKLQPKDEHHRP